jgi:hypothetical protein
MSYITVFAINSISTIHQLLLLSDSTVYLGSMEGRMAYSAFLPFNVQRQIVTYHGSSVGSQQTRQTLQVKHMARSSPVELG